MGCDLCHAAYKEKPIFSMPRHALIFFYLLSRFFFFTFSVVDLDVLRGVRVRRGPQMLAGMCSSPSPHTGSTVREDGGTAPVEAVGDHLIDR